MQPQGQRGGAFGSAPPGWRHLSDHLRTNGATDQELIEAGLGRLSSRGSVIDVSRDRATVAIRDQDGSVLGFVGRGLSGDPQAPKYLNTAQTPVYRKGDVVFGLYEALGAAGTGEQPRLARVEGAFDAIAVSAAGQGRIHGVAPLGTELTDSQAAQLAQHTGQHRVWVGNDADTAGRRATVNDFWRFAGHGLDARLLQWPADQDPAALWQHDPDLLRDALAVPDAAPTAGLIVVDEAIREHHAALMAGDADAVEWIEITRMDVEQVLRNDVDRDLIAGHIDHRLGHLTELPATDTEQLHAAELAAASDSVEEAADHATDPERADRLHELAGSLEESEEVARGRAAWVAAGEQREANLGLSAGGDGQKHDGQGVVYDRATESDLDNLPDLARRARIASAAGFSQSTNDMLNNTQGPGQAAKPAQATTNTGHTRTKSQRR